MSIKSERKEAYVHGCKEAFEWASHHQCPHQTLPIIPQASFGTMTAL